MIDLNRNHLIEAGAGTGKTYALVQALLQALFQKRIPLTQIVALTFTKKAASEMKERVADELRRIVSASTVPEAYRSWGHRLDELQVAAREALEQIDRANISTIHSFAFTLLKRYPLPAGINPNAEVDEKGIRYDEIFELEWPRFLARELREGSPHAAPWLEILAQLRLADVEALARRLCDFEVPLSALPLGDESAPQRLKPLYESIRELAAAHSRKDQTARLAQACEEILGAAASGAWEKLSALSDDALQGIRLKPGQPKGWGDDEWAALRLAQKVAQNTLLRGDQIVARVTERLKPFVAHFRSTVLAEGHLSNSALLALACSLVRSRHDIRAQLQREIRMILIDEFQDTDPRQGELLLFLSEKSGGHAKTWREVQLEAGKLFVVGDPKQSIYRFRGADIAAYRQIADLMLGQGGVATPLLTSRRSHDLIIHAVNQAFTPIMRENGAISPAYVPLEPLRACAGLPLQQVELLLSRADGAQKTDEAQEREARAIAAWISESVGLLHCLDKREGRRRLLHQDIALIFRSTPAMRPFVEALRDRDIPFVLEGERYFYSTPEVTDLINFLRVIENPEDVLALVGLLRSPLAGFTDVELLRLKEAQALDIRRPLPPEFSEARHRLWELLRRLHNRVGREPLRALLARIFEESFVLELAARSYHRDQTVANVLKLKRLLENFAEEGVTTLRVLLAKIRAFTENDRLEGESPLADESYDAVRLLTIHKAKGLEFPVVILPSLHAGRRKGQTEPLAYDWSSGRLGVRVGALQNLDKFYLDAEALEREREEEKRVLYVAMTRARERLVLSGGIGLVRPASECYLEWLRGAWGLAWDRLNEGPAVIGPAQIQVRYADSKPATAPTAPARTPADALAQLDFPAIVSRWRQRTRTAEEWLDRPDIVTPSAVQASGRAAPEPSLRERQSEEREERPRPDDALLLGTLIHRFLERWDFARRPDAVPELLRSIATGYFGALGLSEPERPAHIEAEAMEILDRFVRSSAHACLAQGTVLGRELPFFYSEADGALVRGAIDLLWRAPTGELMVVDYKTDRVRDGSAGAAGGRYGAQGRYYRRAVEAALGETVRFQLLYLRAGKMVEPSLPASS